MQSRALQLPKGYKGVLLRRTDQLAPREAAKLPQLPIEAEGDEELDGDDETEQVKVMEQMGSFSEVVVWGHEAIPEDGDEYVKGIEEWMAFAHAVRNKF